MVLSRVNIISELLTWYFWCRVGLSVFNPTVSRGALVHDSFRVCPDSAQLAALPLPQGVLQQLRMLDSYHLWGGLNTGCISRHSSSMVRAIAKETDRWQMVLKSKVSRRKGRFSETGCGTWEASMARLTKRCDAGSQMPGMDCEQTTERNVKP